MFETRRECEDQIFTLKQKGERTREKKQRTRSLYEIEGGSERVWLVKQVSTMTNTKNDDDDDDDCM